MALKKSLRRTKRFKCVDAFIFTHCEVQLTQACSPHRGGAFCLYGTTHVMKSVAGLSRSMMKTAVSPSPDRKQAALSPELLFVPVENTFELS